MSRSYHCPACQAALDPDRSVILLAHHGDTHALVGFHPQPGEYEVYLPTGLSVEAGSRWDFACPVCQASLSLPECPDLCGLELRQDGLSLRLLFSCIAGEQATFVVRDDGMDVHGEDAVRYGTLVAQLKYLKV